MASSLRILIADDHPHARLALREDLEGAGMEVCAEAEDGAAAVDAALRERPDLCLLDVHMPQDGVTATGAILAGLPGTRVVLITATPTEDGALAAARAGAHGYVGKDVDSHSLAEILRAVAGGETAFAPAV